MAAGFSRRSAASTIFQVGFTEWREGEMLGLVRNFRFQVIAVALLASAASISHAQSPPEDPAKRVEFLEAALGSYQRQLAVANERVAALEATNQVLQKQLQQAAAPPAPAPKDAKK